MITLHTLRLYAFTAAFLVLSASCIYAQDDSSFESQPDTAELPLVAAPAPEMSSDESTPEEAPMAAPQEAQPIAEPAHLSLNMQGPAITIPEPEKPAAPRIKKNKRNNKKEFEFIYQDEDLVNIVNELASLRDINVVLPQGNLAIKAKVTLNIEKPFSLEGAWDLLQTLLDLAGYAIIPKDNVQVIVKKDKDISREALPVFIGTDIEKLPLSDERIRFLYYLSNIKVQKDSESEINKILQGLLPPDASFLIDEQANALVVIARSQDIRAAMQIIIQLDKPGFQERMDFIHLRHSSALNVAELFNNGILKNDQAFNRYHIDARKKEHATYFAQNVRIIPEERSNSLIVVGRAQAVERIKDFIMQYIDVPLDSGQSILHIYELQYLDAETFKPVLEGIINSSRPGGTGQSQAAQQSPIGGTERGFDQVIIQVDKGQGASEEIKKYYGSNKLIIAARNDDWKRIKKLIEELDTPQRQVLIEVLIADITLTDNRLIGGMIRNPAKIPFANESTFQASQLTTPSFPLDPGILPNLFTNPQTIGANDSFTTGQPISSDLLREAFNNQSGAKMDGGNTSLAALLANGSTVLSISDNNGSTWGILQVLKLADNTKILSHPHVLATDNKEAYIEISDSRLVQGSLSNTTGNPIVNIERIDAKLTLKIVPRISATAKTINLNVDINIDQFIGATTNTRTTRKVLTNANINTGDILALGGLINLNNLESTNETPLLSRIPLIGQFFRQRSKAATKTNLTVFISPTIIEPRLRKGIGSYTNDYIGVAKNYANEGALFDTLKEPITRWFFKAGNDANEMTDRFLAQQAMMIGDNEVAVPNVPTTRKQRPLARTCPPRKARWRSRQEHKEQKIPEKTQPMSPEQKADHAKALKERLVEDATNPFSNLDRKDEAVFNPQ